MIITKHERIRITMARNKLQSVNIRAVIWFAVMVAVCVGIIGTLFTMQIIDYEKYQSQVIDNIQQESSVPAERGLIYDRNMIAIATNVTTYRVFISPSDILTLESKSKEGIKYSELIADKLSEILDVDYDFVIEKTQKIKRKDETIKRNVDEETADLIRAFVSENKLTTCLYLEATSMRYYPYGSIASNVIGLTGTDGGLLGIELEYNEYLTGTPGRYITTKNAQSQNMPSDYDTYIEAKDGLSVVSTIDVNIQNMLDEQLEKTYFDNQAKYKTAGIVMNPTTGEVYAMGIYPTFDLNDPYTLDEESQRQLDNSELDPSSKEYNELYWELVYGLWNNKTVSYLYEPGSTMKIMTTSMALQENTLGVSDSFSCSGGLQVGGFYIRCHKTSGHGTHPFSYMLQQSCNPTIMTVASRLGASKFYKYFEDFGYTSVTGIDLPGEARGLYVGLSGFNAVELACYSFGQTFKTTMLQQITAVSTVANGGKLVTPRIVNALLDSDGNTVVSYGTEYKRQVVSESVCKQVLDILADGVSSGNGVKNAYVAGYNVAAKTGTSEKRDVKDKTARIGSCVAVAPADDPQVVVLIVDEPQLNSRFGSTVSAPYVAALLEQVLPYLGIERQYTDEEMGRIAVNVGKYTGMSLEKAEAAVEKLGIEYEVVGDGKTVTNQIPSSGTTMTNLGGKIILYTGNAASDKMVTVPGLVGMNASTAIKQLQIRNLNVLISGASNYEQGNGATVISQSAAEGTQLHEWDVVTIVCRYLDDSDETAVD